MSYKETFALFAEAFVNKEFQERFVHEALKKPRKLHERICHRMEEIFPATYKGKNVAFDPNKKCIVFGWSKDVEETTWSQVSNQLGMGGGVLVINQAATKFYAETEGSPVSVIWAGQRQ
ncbi:hypothetical protein [Methyloversatilis thermotolerans]|uniref:hypothetical protein n=1 Tax=Methyloversatilis thermotolerans TaxID=1346290 RepID=UPI000B496A5C|nr:hypothetical protein [Methyloversatilis thermotolerans]